MRLNLPDILIALFTLATAIAAWFSYCISKKLLKFQKKFSKNEPLIREVQESIKKLRKLLLICNNSSDIPDKTFTQYESLINELKIDFRNYENSNLLKVNEINLKNDYSVDEINKTIHRLENIIENLL